jgi:hypothetical protein
MSSDILGSIKELVDRHAKPENIRYQYGTAGFRTV